ncbi:MAG: MFS transporter, partial [Clostridia bacterium]|nr:MFS transporter [Clostridia bacterium]
MSASQREKFSGWIILIACAISSGFQQALSNTGSLFATYIAADLGVTVGTVLLKNTVMNLVGMLSNMFLAKYIYAKIGTKKSFIVGSLLSVLVYLMYANVSSFAMFMVAAFINGFVVCIGMQTFTTACIAKWFYTGRKTTSSVMMAAIPGAAAVCSLLVGQLLAHFEWRTVYQIMAAIVFVTGCGSSLFVKDSPEQAGQKMLGYDKFLADQKKTGLQTKEEPSIDAADAQKTKFYWILVATVCCFALLSTTLGVYAPVFWQGQGMDVVQSSQLSSIISLLTLVYV